MGGVSIWDRASPARRLLEEATSSSKLAGGMLVPTCLHPPTSTPPPPPLTLGIRKGTGKWSRRAEMWRKVLGKSIVYTLAHHSSLLRTSSSILFPSFFLNTRRKQWLPHCQVWSGGTFDVTMHCTRGIYWFWAGITLRRCRIYIPILPREGKSLTMPEAVTDCAQRNRTRRY